jgi:Protease inhibitor Inh
MRRVSLHSLAATGFLAIALSGCDSSSRFSDFGGQGRQAVAPQAPRAQTFIPAPTGRVDSSPLPPLAGGVASSGGVAGPISGPNPNSGPNPSVGSPNPALGGLPPIGSSVSIDPEPPRQQPAPRIVQPVEPEPAAPPRQQQAAVRPEPSTPVQSSAPSRTSVTGNWTAKEAAGGSCKVTLSSTPTLDLYKASSAGCQSKEMQRVSAWELRGDEIYLYEAGGGVSARLKQSGRNFEGSSSKTGAPVSLSK